MKKLTDYFASRPAFKVSVLERDIKKLNSDYPIGTLKLALNPNQEKEFPVKWVYYLVLALERYGCFELDGWKITADPNAPVFFGERDNPTKDQISEEVEEKSGGMHFEYYKPILKEVWDQSDFIDWLTSQK